MKNCYPYVSWNVADLSLFSRIIAIPLTCTATHAQKRALCCFLPHFRQFLSCNRRLAFHFCESRMRGTTISTSTNKEDNRPGNNDRDVVVPTRRPPGYYAKGRRISLAAGRRVVRSCGIRGEMRREKLPAHTHAPPARYDANGRASRRGSRSACNTCLSARREWRDPALSPTSSWNSVSLIRSLHRRHAIDKSTCAHVCYRL